MPNASDLDFLLIRQKDAILELVNNCEYDKALASLEIVKELWDSCTYSYKYREIRERIWRYIG